MTQRRRDVAERAVVDAALRAWIDLEYIATPPTPCHWIPPLAKAVKELIDLGQPSVDDPAPSAGPNAPDTSRAAQRKAIPHHGGYRRKVYDFLLGRDYRGATDQEMEHALHLPHSTLSSARNSLMRDRWIYDSGARRQTLAKRDAIVWKARASA